MEGPSRPVEAGKVEEKGAACPLVEGTAVEDSAACTYGTGTAAGVRIAEAVALLGEVMAVRTRPVPV